MESGLWLSGAQVVRMRAVRATATRTHMCDKMPEQHDKCAKKVVKSEQSAGPSTGPMSFSGLVRWPQGESQPGAPRGSELSDISCAAPDIIPRKTFLYILI